MNITRVLPLPQGVPDIYPQLRRNKTPRSGCFILMGEYILMLKHINSGFWGPPKGGIQFYSKDEITYIAEDPLIAAQRETKEEINLDVDPRRFFAMVKFHCHYYYIVDSFENTPRPDNVEISEYAWVSFDELCKLNISKTTRRVLADLKYILTYRKPRPIVLSLANISNNDLINILRIKKKKCEHLIGSVI
jgi:8-oxo-dGTP pyrophosphatase MutT (NUDIX family)